jgi:hypothetical protein
MVEFNHETDAVHLCVQQKAIVVFVLGTSGGPPTGFGTVSLIMPFPGGPCPMSLESLVLPGLFATLLSKEGLFEFCV